MQGCWFMYKLQQRSGFQEAMVTEPSCETGERKVFNLFIAHKSKMAVEVIIYFLIKSKKFEVLVLLPSAITVLGLPKHRM